MESSLKELEEIIVFEISDIAHLEDRRFKRAKSEQFTFIDKTYLTSRFVDSISTIENYTSIIKPQALSNDTSRNYIFLLELKQLLKPEYYRSVLIDILKNADEFEKINIVVDYLNEYNDYDSDAINSIISSILNSWRKSNSFQARRILPNMILNNFQLIDPNLIRVFLEKFPGNPDLYTPIEYLNTMDKIMELFKFNTISSQVPKSNFKGFNLNSKIEAGEEELKKWDKENPTWRIENDLG